MYDGQQQLKISNIKSNQQEREMDEGARFCEREVSRDITSYSHETRTLDSNGTGGGN